MEVDVVKKLMMVLAVIVALSCGQAMALYIVDIGSPASEAGFGISIEPDWGPVQPDTSGGNWGGLASDPDSWDKKCRVIWETLDDPSASVTLLAPLPIAKTHLLRPGEGYPFHWNRGSCFERFIRPPNRMAMGSTRAVLRIGSGFRRLAYGNDAANMPQYA